ncbi:hypothetical protein ACHAXT_010475 [Thalassiosira profunda]
MGAPRPRGTKENPKGHARRYNHRRRLIVAVVATITALVLIWRHFFARQSDVRMERRGTMAKHPIRAIDRGAQSAPVVMLRTRLDADLLHRLLEEHLYSCREEELSKIPGLDNRVNPPVYVYEGYYHGLRTEGTVYSRNPNPLIGKDFDKPAAGRFTRAFYEAVREVNGEIFERLRKELLAASTYDVTGNKDVCYVLAWWIQRGYHFGDLSVQIHYGKENEDKLASGRAWHTDAENSLLHLAVTLRGRRVLHSKRIRGRENNSTLLRGQQLNAMEEVLEEQTPGSVYLSSSTLMRHAPQFFDTDYDTRAIAIHARFLYTSEEVDHFRRVRTKESWERLTSVLANTLAAADVRMPSLAQVESRLALLE